MKKKIEVIKTNINRDRRLTRKKQYVITTEVHVKRGTRLIIDDGVTILIENGKKTGQKIGRAALVFDQGSILSAKNFHIRADPICSAPPKHGSPTLSVILFDTGDDHRYRRGQHTRSIIRSGHRVTTNLE